MNSYFETLNQTLKNYFHVLSEEIPSFLYNYIDTPEMQKQAGISTSCGTFYTNLFHLKLWYSSLDHSVATALIIWHFTKDKKQTLAGLFHDIATPTFKHAIDFMNGDYEKQESTEELTSQILSNSKEIMNLLDRDGILLEEVCDYHLYPIADNDTPKLSADRLEYTLSNGLGVRADLWTLEDVKEIYENIQIQKNEQQIEELGFNDLKIAEKFVHTMSILSSLYITNETKISMQFLADVLKKMSEKKFITKDDLYHLSEKEIMNRIENCTDTTISKAFHLWKQTTKIQESDTFVQGKYCVSIQAKIRYIVPLVKVNNEFIRIDQISEIAKKEIEKCLHFSTKKYACLDFNI